MNEAVSPPCCWRTSRRTRRDAGHRTEHRGDGRMASNTQVDSHLFRLSIMLVTVVSASACRTPRDANSGPDAERIYATQVEVNAIVDDTLDVPNGDATDWKSVEVTELSELRVQLHWDDPKALLTLAVHDSLGQQVARGEPFGVRGLEALISKCVAGRYFAVVSASNEAKTTYSLKVLTQKAQPERCHNCTPGQQICLGLDGYAVCEPTPEGCNAWVRTFACKADERCRDGACVAGCTAQCKEEERRCASERAVQVCQKSDDGCLRWSNPSPCGAQEACHRGSCRKAAPTKPTEAERPASAKIRGRVISMVKQGPRMMLHIEIGDENPVKVGAKGWVLSGSSSERMSGGEFKVTQVTGKYCIATTELTALGKNRTVEIELGP